MSARRGRGGRLLALCGALALAAACARREPPANVVLIVVDTLRADALGAHGGAFPTPVMDGLAREGVRFANAVAPASETAPSHATLFTGRGPLRHGLVRNGLPLPHGVETIAETMKASGRQTAGFISNFVLDPRFGWDRGFDHYDADLRDATATIRREQLKREHNFWSQFEADGFDRRAQSTTVAALRWLDQAREPFFLFVHYFDPHDPYVPPARFARAAASVPVDVADRSFPGLRPDELERAAQAYHGEVMYVDEAIGELLTGLRARDVERRTLVVVTADHGEGLGQHGWLGHAMNLHREQVHVPLLLHWPGRLPRGLVFHQPVGLRDVAPTIAELVGAPAPAGATGISLVGAMRRRLEPPERAMVGYRAPRSGGPSPQEWFSVRTGEWRYLRSGAGEEALYHVPSDPGELRSRTDDRPDVLARHRATLDAYLEESPVPAADPTSLGDEVLKALRALGYVQ